MFYRAILLTYFVLTTYAQAMTWTYSTTPTVSFDSSGNRSSFTSQEVKDLGLSPTQLAKSVPSLQLQGSELLAIPGAVFLRGSPSDEVLLLWNGLEINSPSASGGGGNPYDQQKEFSHTLTVLKGPQSLLYGPKALAGTIEWKRSQAAPSKLDLSVGTLQNQKGLIEIQRPFDGGSWGIGGTSSRAQGLSTSADSSLSENDSQVRNSGSVFLNKKLNDQTGIEFVGYASESTSDDDLFGQQDPDARSSERQKAARFAIRQQLQPRDAVLLEIQSLSSVRENRNDPITSSGGYLDKSEGERQKTSFEWNHDWDLGPMTFKADSVFETMKGSSESSAASQNFDQRQMSSGIATVLELKKFNSKFGIRRDEYSSVNERNQSELSGQYVQHFPGLISSQIDPYFSVARGVRFPTLYQRYSFFGNPNLSAQKLQAYEVGLDYTKLDQVWSIGLFKNDYTSMIDYDLQSQKYQNRGQTQILGAEVEGKWQSQFDHWHIGMTALEAQNLTTHQNLVRRPKYSASMTWTHQYSDVISSTGSLVWMAERPDQDLNGPVQLPASWQGEIMILYRPISSLSYSLDLQNIFNSNSPEIATYTVPPRTLIFTVEYLF